VSEYDREASIMRRFWPTRTVRPVGGGGEVLLKRPYKLEYVGLCNHYKSRIFYTEKGHINLMRNVGNQLPDCTVSHLTRL
jgi:hypothetical protein